MTWLSAPMTITSPRRGAGSSDTRTSTTVVSLTNRPAPKSVTRSGARRMMRIGRSSDVVAEIQRAGAAMEADARLEARAAAADSSAATDGAVASGTYANGSHGDIGTNTFEPGEGKSAEESFATQFTAEEKARIRDMVANAASAEEIDRIESLVKRGVFPGSSESGGNGIVPPPPPPPPPPLPEEGNQDNGDEVGEEGDDSKRQRTE